MLLTKYREERNTLFPLDFEDEFGNGISSYILMVVLDWLAYLVLHMTPRGAASLFTLHLSLCLGWVGLMHGGVFKPDEKQN